MVLFCTLGSLVGISSSVLSAKFSPKSRFVTSIGEIQTIGEDIQFVVLAGWIARTIRNRRENTQHPFNCGQQRKYPLYLSQSTYV